MPAGGGRIGSAGIGAKIGDRDRIGKFGFNGLVHMASFGSLSLEFVEKARTVG